MTEKRYTKDPDARLDYGVDWRAPEDEGGPWLESGEDIVSSDWLISPDDATLTIYREENDGSATKVWLEGGTVGESYTVTNRIETDYSRHDDRSFCVVIRNR